MEHTSDNDACVIDRPSSNRRGYFDPARVARASAAMAAAIHEEDDGGFLEDVLRASLQAKLDQISKTNEVRRRHGRPTVDHARLGAIVHDCAPGTNKPRRNPYADSSLATALGEWYCHEDGGCFTCWWVEYDPVATTT